MCKVLAYVRILVLLCISFFSLFYSSLLLLLFQVARLGLRGNMLPRTILRSLIPLTSFTTFRLHETNLKKQINFSEKPFAINLLEKKSFPTPWIDPERLLDHSCGTGQPAQRGRRKPLVWKRRKPWFDHQWTLDLKRVKKGPETPYFPEGVPFTQIRSFQSFSGRSWKTNAGRRRKIRLSLKRGRRKLL